MESPEFTHVYGCRTCGGARRPGAEAKLGRPAVRLLQRRQHQRAQLEVADVQLAAILLQLAPRRLCFDPVMSLMRSLTTADLQ